TRSDCLARITASVARATELADEVEFSAEDATRSDVDFLNAAYQAAAAAGARTMNIPDTVGYSQPQEFAALVLAVRAALSSFQRVAFSVHCHNDLGLAVANTLAAIDAGVDQAHVTMNGLGERGGNASLEETVMALRTRTDHYRADTAVKAERLVATSRLVSELTGIPVQPNKAVVGANAFAHASGIHQDGVLKDPGTYEIMTPQSVGWEARRIVVSKLSGRRGLAARLAELGLPLDGEALDRAYILAMKRRDEVHAAVERDHARPARHARAHPRRRAELASAPTGAARRGLEEGVATHRLPDGEGAHRPLAPRRVRDEGVAHHARRRAALAGPRPQSRVDTDRAFSALVLPAAYPRAHAAADERRRRLVDADAAIAREHRLPGFRRPHPQANARGLTRVAGAKRATWRP